MLQEWNKLGKYGIDIGNAKTRVAFATILLPTLVSAAAIVLAIFNVAVPSAQDLALAVLMYCITMLGVTVGFHRLFAHRSFKTKPLVRLVVGILGSMAAQGPLLFWVAEHRRHHKHTDTSGDPHSPRVDPTQTESAPGGFWHAHVGWMLQSDTPAKRIYESDLLRDPIIRFVNRWYFIWVLLGLLLPGVAAGVMQGSLMHGVLGVLWAGFVRMFLAHHATWCVNSVCHMAWTKTFDLNDQSRNNRWVALITFGEGWHHNHHAFPYSARQGLSPMQIDLSYQLIRALVWLRLADQTRLPVYLDQDDGRKRA